MAADGMSNAQALMAGTSSKPELLALSDKMAALKRDMLADVGPFQKIRYAAGDFCNKGWSGVPQ